jgi:hypothetical protein
MKLNIKTISIVFIVIFLMSRARFIIRWIRDFYYSDILTLEPIRDFPDGARAAITVVFYCLIFVIVWKLILKK